MKANLIALAILLAIAGAALLRAEPAVCGTCLSGFACWNDANCGQGCDCILINGIGHAGVCG